MTAGSSIARSAEIASELRRQILNGKYEAGERLPSERDLAHKLGVHRSSVREALKHLEQLGMIRIRPGGGARVLPLEQAGLGVLPHLLAETAPARELVAQWLDVWELVLAGAARLAVERASKEEFERALELLSRFRSRTLSPRELVEIGDELTGLIAKASRNIVLQMVRNSLTAQLEAQGEVRLQALPSRGVLAAAARDLKAAIESRDAAAVEERVRALLRQNRAFVLDLVAGRAGAN